MFLQCNAATQNLFKQFCCIFCTIEPTVKAAIAFFILPFNRLIVSPFSRVKIFNKLPEKLYKQKYFTVPRILLPIPKHDCV